MRAADALAYAEVLLRKRLLDPAYAMFAEAAREGADPDACAAGRWQCAMLGGRYGEAWAASDEIEARQRAAGVGDPSRFWDGEPLTGKRVMLRCLHGFGDTLQFIRYAPLIREQAASLCIQVHPDLVEVVGYCDGVLGGQSEVITWGAGAPRVEPEWDTQIEIMELPRIFRSMTTSLPARTPYLHAELIPQTPATEALARCMRARRTSRRLDLQCGLAWRSSNWNPLRSVPYREIEGALAELPSFYGYSLQPEGALEFREQPRIPIEDIACDFGQLAARIALLDAVITADGVIAHLAGAIGKPVFLLLPHAADWRWGMEATTPWYPHTQLFRQQRPGEWSGPLAAACEAVQRMILQPENRREGTYR